MKISKFTPIQPQSFGKRAVLYSPLPPNVIAKNLRLDSLFRNAQASDPFESASRAELRRKLCIIVSKFPQRWKEVLSMRYGEGLSTEEISKALNVTRTHVVRMECFAIRRFNEPAFKNRLEEFLAG